MKGWWRGDKARPQTGQGLNRHAKEFQRDPMTGPSALRRLGATGTRGKRNSPSGAVLPSWSIADAQGGLGVELMIRGL